MRFQLKGTKTALIAALGLAFLSGCGSGSGSSPSLIPGGSSSLLPGGCVPVPYPNGYSAVPVNVGFSGQSIYLDTYNLVGGQLPPPPTDMWPNKVEGQVVIGQGGANGGGAMGSMVMSTSSMDGNLNMTVMPLGYQQQGQIPQQQYYPQYYPQNTAQTKRANVMGTLQISGSVAQEIYLTLGIPLYNNNYQYPGQNLYPQQQQQSQACISGVAFNMGYQVNRPYGALYIYLNNTSHGLSLLF